MDQLVRAENERLYLLTLRQLSHGSLSDRRPSGHWVFGNLSGETPSGWATATVAEHWLSSRSHAVLSIAIRLAEVVSVVQRDAVGIAGKRSYGGEQVSGTSELHVSCQDTSVSAAGTLVTRRDNGGSRVAVWTRLAFNNLCRFIVYNYS